MNAPRPKIVFFTGAGMSRESGLPVFRGDGGLWESIDFDKVATLRSWQRRAAGNCNLRRRAMLDFFNPLRRAILQGEPNEGHRIIAGLESRFDVTVITQNGDNYHSAAGSTDVIYLHGEALKNASSANPYVAIDIDRDNPDIEIGDRAPDGSQLRPFVIFFDEEIDRRLWHRALKATREADHFVVVGSSLAVWPAAGLITRLNRRCSLTVIDPLPVSLPTGAPQMRRHIRKTASAGLIELSGIFNSIYQL